MVVDNKKGQVTIFVILGLIVFVLVFILFFAFRMDSRPDPSEVFISQYDPRIAPVVFSVQYCMESLAKEALVTLGLQGGYLDVSSFRYDLQPSYLNNALEFFPSSGQIIPYWYYTSSSPGSSEVSFNIAAPSLDSGDLSIKAQVDDYINDNILECVNYFADFSDDFEVVYGEPASSVLFRDDDILIELYWALNISFYEDDFNGFVNKFIETLDFDFKSTYEIAKSTLYQTQIYSDSPFLEDFTITLLDIISLGGKGARIPPVSLHIDHEFGAPRIWNAFDAKKILVSEISDNSGFLQVKDSYGSFLPLSNDPYEVLIYSSFLVDLYDVDEAKLRRTGVSFDYMPIWPMYVDISPGFGPVITASPKFEINMLGFFNFALTEYQFFYDIAYPILVTIEDPLAFDGEGFVFRYVIEVNVNKNNPFLTDFEELEFGEFELDASFDGFGFVDQRTIPVKVNVVNGYDGSPVSDFNLGYTCIDTIIPVGTSRFADGVALVEGFVPPCIGGSFHSLTHNFHAEKDLSVELGQSYTFNLEVFPEKEIIVRPRKRMYQLSNVPVSDLSDFERRNWSIQLPGSVSLLEENEVLTLMFLNVNDPSKVRIVDIKYPATEATVGLFPGVYDIILFNERVLGPGEENPLLLIEEMTFEVSGGFFQDLFSGKDEVTFNKTEFNNSVVIGGLFLEGDDAFSISTNDLKNNDYLTIFYPSYNFESIVYHHDLLIMGQVLELDDDKKEYFVPEFD